VCCRSRGRRECSLSAPSGSMLIGKLDATRRGSLSEWWWWCYRKGPIEGHRLSETLGCKRPGDGVRGRVAEGAGSGGCQRLRSWGGRVAGGR